MRALGLAFLIIILFCAAGILYLYSGYYDISATRPHWSTTAWLIEQARERSVEFHSKEIKPPDLKDPKLLRIGAEEYHEMCQLCHGAPGQKALGFTGGLYPKPPNLASREIQEMSDAEAFWIVKNGIKLTGMPAFGPGHNENTLWGIVSFWRRLPILSPEQYQQVLESAGVRIEKGKGHHSR